MNLQDTFRKFHIAFEVLDNQLESLTKIQQNFIEYKAITAEQYSVVQKKRVEFQASNADISTSRSIKSNLNKLQKVIKIKLELATKLANFYNNEIENLKPIQKNYSALINRYTKKLTKQKNRDLFHRNLNVLSTYNQDQLSRSLNTFIHQGNSLFSIKLWISKVKLIQKSNPFETISFTLLLIIVIAVCWRFKRFLVRLESGDFFKKYPSIVFPSLLLKNSIFLFGMTVYLYTYVQVQYFSLISGFVHIFIDVLITWLFTRWGLLLLDNWNEDKVQIPPKHKKQLKFVLLFIRWNVIGFLLIRWGFLENKFIPVVSRLPLEIVLVGVCLYFWKTYHQTEKRGTEPSLKSSSYLIGFTWISYSIVFAGLLFELTGYGNLAVFWYQGWGKTLIASMWATFILLIVREISSILKTEKESEDDVGSVAHYQLRWFSIRLIQLIGPIMLMVILIMIWGGRDTVMSNTHFILTYRFSMGKMGFSLMSMIYAILILLGTHAISRLWRKIFQNRFLHDSRIEPGVQDSVTTITVYVIWVFGIMFAMNAFGLDPTTLVVVFGALGIGLGFGLQNIFNNFMSGLILLFERPIQVGDDIELNGVWATVKKINVRSTLVQTYDNASLIIPNSDLINNQVTNWSFKDKRLRRDISIGIAYGSDIVLAKKLLLEVANSKMRVLRYPEPEVLFRDFGDSALVFKLRFWSLVDYFIQVESELRFDIDEIFNKNNIVIAFPQKDVHLHMVDSKVEEPKQEDDPEKEKSDT